MTQINSPTKEDIDKLSSFIELDHKVWTHYSEFLYEQQFSRIKNYLWLSVTIITFLAAIFANYLQPGLQLTLSVSQKFAVLFWSIAGIASSLSVILGIISLSSIWNKDIPQDPYRGGTQYIARFERYGINSQEHYEDLKNLDAFYVQSMESYVIQIEQRTSFLRHMNLLLIISVIFLILSFSVLFINQIGGN
ncbi:hypothetical protein [uncultured Succinivibrio sp.]|uniref:hypothetical protein n=1 Tax=uncultured Succinivibrio sp. TaxID=540749 RepID=UPI0025F5D917|nr:hypothetical protein [uncultured Succinivibrio sp.]